MKLSSLKRDVVAIEQGQWIEGLPQMGDLRLKLRGSDNMDARKLRQKLIDQIPARERSNITIEKNDQIVDEVLIETIVVDWGGLTGDDGQPIPYSKEKCAELIRAPEYRAFREIIVIASAEVGANIVEASEADSKN